MALDEWSPCVTVDGSARVQVGLALIAIDYRDGAYPDLPLLRKGVAELGQLWKHEPVQRGLQDLDLSSDPVQLLEAVRRWCDGLRNDQVLVLYWGGHGVVEAGRHWLLARDSPPSRLDHQQAIGPDDLGRILAHSPARAVLVIVDACHSGEALRDIADAVLSVRAEQHVIPPFGVLASCRPFEEASDGLLIEQVVELLEKGPVVDPSRWTEHDRMIRVGAFVAEVRERLRGQRPEWNDHDGISELSVIPNPRWAAVADEADVETKTRLRALWRSRAVPHFLAVSEHFFGRHAVLADIIGWLAQADHGTYVVTGQPGTGKSAVIGRLALLADPYEYTQLADAGLVGPDDPVPPRGVFDAVVHVQGKTAAHVLEELAQAADLTGAVSADDLVERLGERGRRLTVLVDALDEASSGQAPACADVLRKLGGVPGCRLIVGTRPDPAVGARLGRSPLLDTLQADIVRVLDEEVDTEADITSYVERRLLADAGSPYQGFPADARAAATEVARRVQPVFLLARVAARWLTGQPDRITSKPDWEQELAELSGEESLARTLDADLRRRYGPDLHQVLDLLGALAWAEGQGLPRYGVWPAVATALSGRTYGDDDISVVLATAGWYIKESGEDDQTVYRLYHQAFVDYFRQTLAADEQTVQAAITGSLRALAERLPGGWFDANPYLRRHLPAHAAAAQAGDEPGPLDDLLADSSFLVAADPNHLARALYRAASYQNRAVARVYLRATHLLGTATPPQRASILTLLAAQEEPTAAPIRALPDSPWRARWAAWRPTPFHLLLSGHADKVRAVAFAQLPDNRVVLASGSGDRTVRLWDPTSGQLLRTLTGHKSLVRAVAFGQLPNGQVVLASGGYDGTVRLWDAISGHPINALTGHKSGVQALAFGQLPDGQVVLASGSTDQTVRLWDATNGQPIYTFTAHEGYVRAVAFGQLPNGQVVLASGGKDRVRLWDPVRCQRWSLPALIGHKGGVSAVAFSSLPDGRVVLASASYGGTLELWDPTSGQLLRTLSGYKDRMRAAAFGQLPDGRVVLASASYGGILRLWDPTSGRPAGPSLPCHEYGVQAVALGRLPNGQMVLASGSDDRTVRLWDPTTEEPISALAGHEHGVQAVALGQLPDGRVVVLASGSDDHIVRLWDPARARRRPLTNLVGHEDRVRGVAFGRLLNGRIVVASGSNDRTVRLWDATSGQALHTFTEHEDGVQAVALGQLPDGRMTVASGSDDRTVRLWLPGGVRRRWRLLTTLTGHRDKVQAVAFGRLPDDRVILASGSDDRTVRLWDVTGRQPQLLGTLTGHRDKVQAVAFGRLPDGRVILASGSDDRTVRLWDPASGQELITLATHDAEVPAVTFTWLSDGRMILASGSNDGKVRLWEPANNRLLASIPLGAPCTSLAARDPGWLAIGSQRGVVVLDLLKLPNNGRLERNID